MADPLLELLTSHLTPKSKTEHRHVEQSNKYLSRLLSLRLSDLTTAEPQSLSQASHSNLVSIQALSARSHRTTTASSDHLTTLSESLPSFSRSAKEVCEAIPPLDESAVSFATTYSKPRDQPNAAAQNTTITSRKEAQLLSQQADKLQDILELPQLLSTAIASASSGTAGSTNYSQALDLFAHIRRLQIIYPDSALIKSIQIEAEIAMKDMIVNLVQALRSPSLRLPAAIRTIGWLRRVVPELGSHIHLNPASQTLRPQHLYPSTSSIPSSSIQSFTPDSSSSQDEGTLGLLFLTARLSTFLSTIDALSPLRDLADQESDRRQQTTSDNTTSNIPPTQSPHPPRRSSTMHLSSSNISTPGGPTGVGGGHQTERYLKRYIEVFREHSFATIDMYRKIFPAASSSSTTTTSIENGEFQLPQALQSFPLHLVEMLTSTLRTYLPNMTDSVARESLLMQVLYAAGSLGRLGADFSLVLASLDTGDDDGQKMGGEGEPEWMRVMRKHRVQSARLDALAAGKEVGGTKREVVV